MKRPAGVILTSIVLGLLAGLQLLFALITLVAIPSMRSVQTAVAAKSAYPPGTVPPPPGLMIGVTIAYAVFLAMLATWAIVTLIGLVGLRNWARYSILSIGGCMTGLGVLALVVAMLAAALVPSASVPPSVMRAAVGVEAVFSAMVAAVGIWWLVYFNMAGVKGYFVPEPGSTLYVPTSNDGTV